MVDGDRNGCVMEVVDEGFGYAAVLVVGEGFGRSEFLASTPTDGEYRECIASL
jgi:hypothetical protein